MNEMTLKKSQNEALYPSIHICSLTCHACDLTHAIDRQNVRMMRHRRQGTAKRKGSWWPDWAKWMADKSGPKVKAPTPGSGKLKVIEDAPGTYVRARAE